MKIKRNLPIIVIFASIWLGLILRSLNLNGGAILLTIGFLTIIISSAFKTFKAIESKRPRFEILLIILIGLMSLSLHSKYLYFFYGDYPSLLIVPLFIISFIIYLFFYNKKKDNWIISISVMYLILVIPLLGLNLNKSPRLLLPQEWYNTMGNVNQLEVNYSYQFKKLETKNIRDKALKHYLNNEYYDAINLYEKALDIEPINPGLCFEISQVYSRTNDLELAIWHLDTAIAIDSTFAGFYNNRGLLYYKLKQNAKAIENYKTAIKLDSLQPTVYSNIALAYYYSNNYMEAKKAFIKADSLGLLNVNPSEYEIVKQLINE